MKRILIAAMVIVLGAGSALAGGGFGLYGSYWDTKDADESVGGGIKLQIDLAETVALEFRASDFEAFDEDNPTLKDLVVVPLEADLIFMAPVGDVLTFYAGGGAGYYVLPEYEVHTPMGASLEPDVDPEDTVGFFAVGGLELGLTDAVALFAEVKYNWLKIDKADVDGNEVNWDLDLGGTCGSAGILFRW